MLLYHAVHLTAAITHHASAQSAIQSFWLLMPLQREPLVRGHWMYHAFADRHCLVHVYCSLLLLVVLLLLQRELMVRGHWMYRALDTALATGRKKKAKKGKDDDDAEETEEADDGKPPYVSELPSGDSLKHPRQLWVCGSDVDNDRYDNCYQVQQIDRCVRVSWVQWTVGRMWAVAFICLGLGAGAERRHGSGFTICPLLCMRCETYKTCCAA
jgi:hypothetical protein